VHFILLNGPPRCGKDTLAEALVTAGRRAGPSPHWYHRKFADPVKDGAVDALIGMGLLNPGCTWDDLDEVKDTPLKKLLSRTPREIAIAFSERFAKPLFGVDVFGRLMSRWAENLGQVNAVIVVSDCGFDAEVEALQREYGDEACTLVEIRRPGCTFKGDSRNYLRQKPNHLFINDGTVEELQNFASLLVRRALSSLAGQQVEGT